jgi:hypothetical protein
MSKQKYFCKHFDYCERKTLCKSQCKKCTHCKEDFKDVLFDASESNNFKGEKYV